MLRKGGETVRAKEGGVEGGATQRGERIVAFSYDARFPRWNEKEIRMNRLSDTYLSYLPGKRESLPINSVMSAPLCFLSFSEKKRAI